MKAVLCFGLCALLWTVSVPEAQATKIIPMDPEKLAQVASTVVQGTVVGIESYWNASHSKVFTETIVAVEESFKGAPGSEVRILQLGGEVDGIRVTVHGALYWNQGEEVVLFLEPYQGDKYQVSGFSQGKFKVERDPVSGRAFVFRPALEGVELADDDGHQHADQATFKRVPLDRFLAKALGDDYQPSNR